MGIKEELIKFKNKLINRKKEDLDNLSLDHIIDPIVLEKSICLDDKVDNYIKWDYEHFVKGNYTEVGEYRTPIELRNFIEKMAVWYELRYPDYEINRLMPGSGQEEININDVMFNDNTYINSLFDEDADVRAMDFSEFYNAHTFIQSLPWEEAYRLQKVRYRSHVYLDPNCVVHDFSKCRRQSAHLHLTTNGFVKEAEEIDVYSEYKVSNKELIGMHIKDVLKLFEERYVLLPYDNELEEAIRIVDKWKKRKEGLLDAVMYRIIERGGNRMGPRRGLLFAKEFKRNIDIPMIYGVDYSDPGLRLFINEYIKSGGDKNLVCYVGYFSRTNNKKKFDTVTIDELLLRVHNNCKTFYTPEETSLHQRLVNVISSQINYEELRKEEVKQLRLQRKMDRDK